MLLNMGCLLTVYAIVAVSYPVLAVLSLKYRVVDPYLEKFMWNVVIRTGLVTFFPLFLAVVVQFKYVLWLLICAS